MALHPSIVEHLGRLGVELPADLSASAVDLLVNHIEWPNVRYGTSWNTLRDQAVARGFEGAEEWDDDRLLDYSIDEGPRRTVHLVIDRADQGSFYDGMEDIYSGTDPEKTVPWASDWAYLFFLGENPDDASNPFVFVVDHETPDEEPWSDGLTVGQWVSVLEIE